MSDVQTDLAPGPPSDEGATDDVPRSRRGRWVAGGVAALVAVIVLVVVLAGGDDGDDGAEPDPSTPAPSEVTPGLDASGSELADLLALGREQTVHATYRATGGDDLTLEIWRKDGRVRQDTHVESEAGSADTAGFLLDGESIACSRRDDEDWTCSSSSTEASPDGLFGTVVDQLSGAAVEASDDEVDGREVRCFRFDAADGTGEMCVTADGIPVRAVVGDSGLELVDTDDDVDDSVFDPPAEVESAD